MMVRPCVQNVIQKTGEASPVGYTHGKAGLFQGPGGPITSLTWLCFRVEPENYQRLLKIVRCF